MAAKVTSAGEFAENWMKLLFQGVDWPGIATADLASPGDKVWVSLHTANPGPSGNQATNESQYQGYKRVGVDRSTAAWIVTGNSVSPAAPVTFPTVTAGSEELTYLGIGQYNAGAGHLFYWALLQPSIQVVTGLVPELLPTTQVEET